MPQYILTMTIDVPDEEALYEAAMRHLTEKDGLPRDEAEELLRDAAGEVRPESCLAEMIDPGPSGVLPFAVIASSSVPVELEDEQTSSPGPR